MVKRPKVLARYFVFVIFVIFLSGQSILLPQPAIASSSQLVPFFAPAECMFDLPAGWIEGQQVDCGYLTVLEQYEVPDGPTIQLAVAILRSQATDKKPDPLVMLQGGPGGSTIDTYTQILSTNDRLPGDRDIVLFDQRGTLYSKPALTCPEFLDLTIATLDQILPDEESNRLSLEALQNCRDRLESEGINLNAYDSLENAADVESLRIALGFEKINLYGVSYGTLLALHVMRDYPQGLRSVIIDSVVPTQTNFILGAPKAENRSFEALFSACEEDLDCNASYPDLRKVFYDLVDDLNDNPARISLTDYLGTGQVYEAVIDGDSFLSTIFQIMYNSEFIPYLPRVIYNVQDGEWRFIERILPFIVFDRTMSYGMYYSVLCAEDSDFTVDEYDLSGLPQQIAKLEEDSAQYILDACKLWNVDQLGPEVDVPVMSDIPTLVLSGNFDPITPPEYALLAAQGLSQSIYLLFPAGSHGQIGGNACADGILLQFLDQPNQKPEISCIEKSGQIKFSTKTSLVSLPILVQLLNLQGGTGWQLLLYFVGLGFLLTALVVYPVAFIVSLMKGKPRPGAHALVLTGEGNSGNFSIKPIVKNSLLFRMGQWSAFLNAGILLIFTVILVVLIFNLALSNDVSILFGLPASARPLFLLLFLSLLLTLAMFLGAIGGWIRASGSLLGRFYLTLLFLAAFACTAILFLWNMLFAFLI